MKLKHKISLLVIGILLVVSLLISSSYALWVFNVSQESTNVLVSDCFEITLQDNNLIGLSASFPMKDGDGVKTTPYTFTIKNKCNHPADFQINLETLNTSTIDESFIKADLNGRIIEYNSAESIETTIDGAKSAIKLYEDTLAVNSSKKYNLRIWVNEIATQEDVENKSYSSKISVRATVRKQYAEGTLIEGPSFNKILKTLSGDTDASYISINTSIVSVQRSFNEPLEEDNAVNIATSGTTTPIYAWFKDGIIYIYTTLDKIYLNNNSSYMFRSMTNLTSLDVSYFDTSNVTDMGRMFSNLNSLTSIDLSNFDTSNVTNMMAFINAAYNLTSLDLSNFNTSKVINMSYMFQNCYKLSSLDLSNFVTSRVSSMSYMFNGMNGLTSLDLSNFDTSNVANMSGMFLNLEKITNLNLGNSFDTSKVTNMQQMFSTISNIEYLDLGDKFDTSNVTNMIGMFMKYGGKKINFGNKFNLNSATNIRRMFYDARNLEELDLSFMDTSHLKEITEIFHNASSLKTIYVSDKFDVSSVELASSMFSKCNSLVGGAGTTYDSNHVDAEYARIDDPDNGKPGYFTLKTN